MEHEDAELLAMQAYDSAKSAHKRLDALEQKVEDIHELTSAVSRVNQKVDDLVGDMGEIKADVKKVTERPGQWWDKLIAAALGAVASGLVAALLAQILR